jgi:hypothetical protein
MAAARFMVDATHCSGQLLGQSRAPGFFLLVTEAPPVEEYVALRDLHNKALEYGVNMNVVLSPHPQPTLRIEVPELPGAQPEPLDAAAIAPTEATLRSVLDKCVHRAHPALQTTLSAANADAVARVMSIMLHIAHSGSEAPDHAPLYAFAPREPSRLTYTIIFWGFPPQTRMTLPALNALLTTVPGVSEVYAMAHVPGPGAVPVRAVAVELWMSDPDTRFALSQAERTRAKPHQPLRAASVPRVSTSYGARKKKGHRPTRPLTTAPVVQRRRVVRVDPARRRATADDDDNDDSDDSDEADDNDHDRLQHKTVLRTLMDLVSAHKDEDEDEME